MQRYKLFSKLPNNLPLIYFQRVHGWRAQRKQEMRLCRHYFKDGLAKVSDSKNFFFRDKWVYIDKQGRVVK